MHRFETGGNSTFDYGIIVVVWAGLLFLTWATVTFTGARPVRGVGLPLAIASVKASLVVLFFMRLRFEKGLFRLILPIAIMAILVVSSLVFSDVFLRY